MRQKAQKSPIRLGILGPEKYCTSCHAWKCVDDFYFYSKNDKKETGYRPECKSCTNLRNEMNTLSHMLIYGPNYWNDYMKNWYKTRETPKQRERRRKMCKINSMIFLKRHPNYHKNYYIGKKILEGLNI